VTRSELIDSLRRLIEMLEQDGKSSPEDGKANPAVA
jgi:hypothetical protein